MGGLNQVICCLLRDIGGRIELSGRHRDSRPGLWRHRQNTSPRTHTRKSLTHIGYYMDDVISVVQGGPKRQH